MNGTYQTTQTGGALSFSPEDSLNFKKIGFQLYRNIWTIILIGVLSTILAFIYTLSVPPSYQSIALLQAHQQTPNNGLLGKLGYKASNNSFIDAQQALIRTRYILEPVINQLHLNVSATPHYFPIFGAWKARRYKKNDLAKPFLGLKSYAWGGEKIMVKQLTVPDSTIEYSFKLIAGGNNSYQVFSGKRLILAGKAGEIAKTANGEIQLEITDIKARPGTEFSLNYQPSIEAVKALAHNIQISNLLGNDPLQNTGIFQIKLSGNDRQQVVKTLNAIATYTSFRNFQENIKETQSTLKFLEKRLPQLKSNLLATENSLNLYHQKLTSLSMNTMSILLLQQLRSLEQTLDKLKSQKEELLQIYTENHPVVTGAVNKQIALENRIKELKVKIKQFPFINQEELNLLREIKIKNSMYLSLLSTQQQLQIAKAALTSNIVVISDAIPAVPLSAYKLLIILGGGLIGIFLSSIIFIIKGLLDQAIEDPETLEEEIQIPLYSIIPFSHKQSKLEKAVKKATKIVGGPPQISLILAKEDPEDIAVESLRSLRIGIQMMGSTENPKVIALMGSTSNIGKSFVSLNLSQVIADSGKRTLLIDADVRKGRLHKALLQPKNNGLSEYLESKITYEKIIRTIHDELFFISCGVYTTHPLALFQNVRFQHLLENVRKDFEQIIIDTPPILPVTDALLITKYCDIKIFVVSANKDTLSDVKQAIKKARVHDIDVNGMVFNHRQPVGPYGSRYYERYAYETIRE